MGTRGAAGGAGAAASGAGGVLKLPAPTPAGTAEAGGWRSYAGAGRLWPPGKPQVLWFDGPTGTALVLDAHDVHRVSLFPGPCVVIQSGDCSVAVSRAERGWGVHGLAGRPTLHQLLGLPAVVAAVLAMGRGLN